MPASPAPPRVRATADALAEAADQRGGTEQDPPRELTEHAENAGQDLEQRHAVHPLQCSSNGREQWDS
jgi:hypothetical protein